MLHKYLFTPDRGWWQTDQRASWWTNGFIGVRVRVRGCLPEHEPLKGWCSTEKPTSTQVTIPLLETGTLAFSVTSRQFQESLSPWPLNGWGASSKCLALLFSLLIDLGRGPLRILLSSGHSGVLRRLRPGWKLLHRPQEPQMSVHPLKQSQLSVCREADWLAHLIQCFTGIMTLVKTTSMLPWKQLEPFLFSSLWSLDLLS